MFSHTRGGENITCGPISRRSLAVVSGSSGKLTVMPTLSAQDTVAAARSVGLKAQPAENAQVAVEAIAAHSPHARILIGGSLYFAGVVLEQNG